MINIYSLIYNTLLPLNYQIKEEGTFPPNAVLPETYITYLIVSSPNETHYDDTIASTTYRVQLNLYSKKPSIKQSADFLLKSVMIPANFLRIGGRDLPFNSDTGHYCYSCDYRYLDQE